MGLPPASRCFVLKYGMVVGSLAFSLHQVPAQSPSLPPETASYLCAPALWGMAPIVQSVISQKVQTSWVLQDLQVSVVVEGTAWRFYLLTYSLSYCLSVWLPRQVLCSVLFCSVLQPVHHPLPGLLNSFLTHSSSWNRATWGQSCLLTLLGPGWALYTPSQGLLPTLFCRRSKGAS